MFSRIFILLVTVCVVKASVLTANVFNDDPYEVANNPKDCNPQGCDQLCRRLKLPGGACVNGRCKCDNFLNVEDVLEAGVQANPPKCKDKACNWLCRALNNTSGACADGHCKCTKSVVAGDYPEAKVAPAPSRCRDKACDSVCRALNNTSGACVNGRCKCTKSHVAEDVAPNTEVDDSVSQRACNNKRCHQMCRKQKFRGGACVGANCYCNQFLSQQEDTMTDPAEYVSRRSCNRRECDDKCHRTGWYGGVCINGQCKCDHFLDIKDAMNDLHESIDDDFLNDHFFNTEDCVDEYSETDARRGCRITKCNRTCTRLGYDSATCVSRRCKCFNKTQATSETSLPVSELSEDQNERGCDPQGCDQSCRRLKFPGGACVNGRCKCDNFFGTEDAVNEYSELDTRRSCRITKCNRTCTRRGYDSATCVNHRCKCYNKTQDASPVNEVICDENEESKEILSTNEEELTDVSPRACNTRTCHPLCQRRGYAGGRCRYDQCQCFN